MIKSIDETEVLRLLETAETLLNVCKKNNLLAKHELDNAEDQTYYFRQAFNNDDFSFSWDHCRDNDIDHS